MEIARHQVIDSNGAQLIAETAGLVPGEYQQIAWLDNNVSATKNAAAYVNTGIQGLDGRMCKIEIDAAWAFRSSAVSTQWNILFAAQASDNDSGTFQIRVHGTSGNAQSAQLISNLNEINKITVLNGQAFHATLDGQAMTVDGERVATTCGSTTAKGPLYIGKPQWDRGSEFRYWQGLLGRCKVFGEDGQTVGDLVPVSRKADGVCGYFDIARNLFIPSANSIQFMEGRL